MTFWRTALYLVVAPVTVAVAAGASIQSAAIGTALVLVTVFAGREIGYRLLGRSPSVPVAFGLGIIMGGVTLLVIPATGYRAWMMWCVLIAAGAAARTTRVRSASSCVPTPMTLRGGQLVLSLAFLVASRQNVVLLVPAVLLAACFVLPRPRIAIPTALALASAVLAIAGTTGRTLAGLNNDQLWDIANATGFARFGIDASIAQQGVEYSYYKFGHLWLGAVYHGIGVQPALEGIWLTVLLGGLVIAQSLHLGRIADRNIARVLGFGALIAAIAIPEIFGLDLRHPLLVATLLLLVALDIFTTLGDRAPHSAALLITIVALALVGSRSTYALIAFTGLIAAARGTGTPRIIIYIGSYIAGCSLAVVTFFAGALSGEAPLPNSTVFPSPLTSLWTLVVSAPWRITPVLVLCALQPSQSDRGARQAHSVLRTAAIGSSLVWCFFPRHQTQSDLVWITILLAGLALLASTHELPEMVRGQGVAHTSLAICGLLLGATIVVARRLTQFPGEFVQDSALARVLRPIQPDAWGTAMDLPSLFASLGFLTVVALVILGAHLRRWPSRRLGVTFAATVGLGASVGVALVAPATNVFSREPLLGHGNDPVSTMLDVDRHSNALAELPRLAHSNDLIATSIHDWERNDPADDGLPSIAYLTRMPMLIEAPLYGSIAAERSRDANADDPLVQMWRDRIALSTALGTLDASAVSTARSIGVDWLIRRPVGQDGDYPPGLELVAQDDRFEIWRIASDRP